MLNSRYSFQHLHLLVEFFPHNHSSAEFPNFSRFASRQGVVGRGWFFVSGGQAHMRAAPLHPPLAQMEHAQALAHRFGRLSSEQQWAVTRGAGDPCSSGLFS